MENLLKKLEDLRERFLVLKAVLDIDGKTKQWRELSQIMAQPDFWQNQEAAVKIGQEAESLSREVKEWQGLEKEIEETVEMVVLAEKEQEPSLNDELAAKYLVLADKFTGLEFLTLLSGEHDKDNAILSIHAGTGGVDAQDWAQMLLRMYLRFCEQRGLSVQILDQNDGNEAGIKNVIIKVSGNYAYGYLQSENGVHRLLRVSPFDAENLRQTSFALVEVAPELPEADNIVVQDDDLEWDVFRSSGPGGQSVNTTDSAVRVTHKPSGITVSCQSERSQHQNRENALKILKVKLYKLALEEREGKERELKGEVQKAEWGKQIRSYFLYGNRLVKDHRSNFETSDVDGVLDGALSPFIEAYLRFRLNLR